MPRKTARKPPPKKLARKLKLAIELAPESSWYRDIRRIFTPEEWKLVQARTLTEHGHLCAVCGADGELRCNPVWEYHDRKSLQKLTGFTVLCVPCHLVWHLDETEEQAGRGQVDLERVIRHFMRVNRCRRSSYELHRKEAMQRWRRRSKREWQVDLQARAAFLEAPQMIDSVKPDWLERRMTQDARACKRSGSDSSKVDRWVRKQSKPESKRRA